LIAHLGKLKKVILFVGILLCSPGFCSETKISPHNPYSWNFFGSNVVISGETVLVGSPGDQNPLRQGSAYIYKYENELWSLDQWLSPINPADITEFSRRLDLSGSEAVVSSLNKIFTPGVYVYLYSDTGSEWANTILYHDGFDYLGSSVSINDDLMLLGAIGDDENGYRSGAAYIYRKTEGNWMEEQKLYAESPLEEGEFGSTVLISGTHAFVKSSSNGISLIQEFIDTGSNWNSEQIISHDSGENYNSFGFAMDVSGDYLFIGYPKNHSHEEEGLGSVIVYRSIGSSWVETQVLSLPEPQIDDYYGVSVSVQGNYAAIGSYTEEAHYYINTGAEWVLNAVLTASDSDDNAFGQSVSVSEDGDRVVVGAPMDDDEVDSGGAVYIFDDLLQIPTPTPSNTSTVTPTGNPTSTASPVPSSSPFPTETPTPVATSSSTPTETPASSESPTPVPTDSPVPPPSSTPTEIPVLGVDLDLSGGIFHRGDHFLLTARVTNPGPETYQDHALVFVLDIHGLFLWYPFWSETFDYVRVNLEIESFEKEILNFTWPEVSGSSSGILFYGALLDPSFSSIVGSWDWVSFGWS